MKSNTVQESLILKRKRKTKVPCVGCRMHRDRCVCNFIPNLNLKTRITLIIHKKELKRTTNTGQLALRSLSNSELRIRGESDKKTLDLTNLLTSEYRTFLFFPSEDAIELTPELVRSSQLPIQLIVPDGNWRQASKVHSRHPELHHVQKVKISTVNKSTYHLRAEHLPEGMATLEAIAFALGIIEGEDVKNILLNLYQAKLKNTLLGRGQKVEC